MIGQGLRSQTGITGVRVLRTGGCEGLIEGLVLRQDRDGRQNLSCALAVIILVLGRRECLLLNTLSLRGNQGQILQTLTIRYVVSRKAHADRLRDRRRRQTEREGERTLTLDKGDVLLAPLTESDLRLTALQFRITRKEIRGLEGGLEGLLTFVPQEEVHVKDDLLVAVEHRCRCQQDDDHSIRHLDQTLQTRGDLLVRRGILGADVVCLVDDEQAIIKVLVNPGLINVLRCAR